MDTGEQKQRMRKARRLMERHPDHVPVIIVSNVRMSVVKFLPHKDSSVGEFMKSVRNYTPKLKETDGLLIFVSDIMPPMTMTIGELYREYSDPDGYLHVRLCRESTFG